MRRIAPDRSLFLDVMRNFSKGVIKDLDAFPPNRSLFLDAMRNFSQGVIEGQEAFSPNRSLYLDILCTFSKGVKKRPRYIFAKSKPLFGCPAQPLEGCPTRPRSTSAKSEPFPDVLCNFSKGVQQGLQASRQIEASFRMPCATSRRISKKP